MRLVPLNITPDWIYLNSDKKEERLSLSLLPFVNGKLDKTKKFKSKLIDVVLI